MERYRYLVDYNPTRWIGGGRHRRLAPFIVWAETEELALVYAREWVGAPLPHETAQAYYFPSGAMLDA